MSTFTVTSKAYPSLLPTPEDLPKCTCGGKFIVEDVFNKRHVHQLSSAVCEDCGEYFCGYDLNDLYRAIPSGQKARAVDNSSYKIERK